MPYRPIFRLSGLSHQWSPHKRGLLSEGGQRCFPLPGLGDRPQQTSSQRAYWSSTSTIDGDSPYALIIPSFLCIDSITWPLRA